MNFWDVINDQLTELRSAKTADDVLRILSHERNPYGDPTMSSGDGFFAGSGGDGSVMEALNAADWSVVWMGASYYYVMQYVGPTGTERGDKITYVEGDIFRGDTHIS